jgi:hypothetical protein
MISVISNWGCVGFVIRRRHEFEGLTGIRKPSDYSAANMTPSTRF